jgi:hypothetical protein
VNSNAVVLQGRFGGMSLMAAMRTADKNELYICTKKAVIIFIYDKNKTENNKNHHFKGKIVKQNKIREEQIIGTRGWNPGRLGTSPTL